MLFKTICSQILPLELWIRDPIVAVPFSIFISIVVVCERNKNLIYSRLVRTNTIALYKILNCKFQC